MHDLATRLMNEMAYRRGQRSRPVTCASGAGRFSSTRRRRPGATRVSSRTTSTPSPVRAAQRRRRPRRSTPASSAIAVASAIVASAPSAVPMERVMLRTPLTTPACPPGACDMIAALLAGMNAPSPTPGIARPVSSPAGVVPERNRHQPARRDDQARSREQPVADSGHQSTRERRGEGDRDRDRGQLQSHHRGVELACGQVDRGADGRSRGDRAARACRCRRRSAARCARTRGQPARSRRPPRAARYQPNGRADPSGRRRVPRRSSVHRFGEDKEPPPLGIVESLKFDDRVR